MERNFKFRGANTMGAIMHKFALIYFLALYMTEIFGMSEEMQELIDQLHNTCVSETGAAEDSIVNARKGDFADDENFKCYFKCLFDQMGCMTEEGTVDVEATIAVMPPELADKVGPIVRKCTEVGANPCETAWLANKCYYKGNPEVCKCYKGCSIGRVIK